MTYQFKESTKYFRTVQVFLPDRPASTTSTGGGLLSGITSTLGQAASLVTNLIGGGSGADGVNKIGQAATGGVASSPTSGATTSQTGGLTGLAATAQVV